MQQQFVFSLITLLIGVFHRITEPSNALTIPKPSAPPHFLLSRSTLSHNLSVLEEARVGTIVANLLTLLPNVLPQNREADGGAPAPLSLTLLRGAPYVALDQRGALVVASRIDREDPALCPPAETVSTKAATAVCSLPVSVLVQTHIGQSGFSRPITVSFAITVLDIDDNSPQFTVNHMDAAIPENSPINSLVLRAPIAHDADSAPDHWTPVEYRLVGSDAHYFTFVHNASSDTLALHVAEPIDREQLASPTLKIYVLAVPQSKHHQQNENLVSILNVSVVVIDANEFDLEFVELPTAPINLPENTETGTQVWRLAARDPDADGGPIEFRMGASADDSVRRAFRLESASGRILVANSQELDYERIHEFLLPVKIGFVNSMARCAATISELMHL